MFQETQTGTADIRASRPVAAPREIVQMDGGVRPLSSEELADISSMSRQVTYKPGAHLFRQGDPHEGIVFIVSGKVHTYYLSPQGREVTLAYWPSGHFVGAPQLLSGGEHMWSSVAITETTGLIMTGKKVTELVYTRPNLALVLIEGLIYKSKCYTALLQMLGTQSNSARLAQLLLTLTSGVESNGERLLPHHLTQQELAGMIGATRQSVAQSLDKFEQDRLIRRSDRGIVVVDAMGLRQLCE